MSKEIFLYSEDKKYKCCFELADSLDKFKCPDHSVMILFEERKNGTYVIAQAIDKTLATEKDQKIADLEAKLAESEEKNKELVKALNGEVFINYKVPMENAQLKQQLAEKDKEQNQKAIEQLEKVKELCIKDMTICEDYFAIEKILDQQIKELKHENKGE